MSLLKEKIQWPDTGHPRRAAISSFGISGTNAHVIVEGPRPVPDAAPVDAAPASAVPWVLSGRTERGLRAQATRLHAHLAARPEFSVADVGLSLATTRSRFDDRAVIVGHDREEFLASLAALARGEGTAQLARGSAVGSGKVAFLFTGQGSQRPGMGSELYEAHPVFAQAFDEVCGHLDSHLGRSLRNIVFAAENSADSALLHQTVYTQAALFAIETALFRLIESWGLRPDYLLGHSIGELTAAHVAGALSLPEACTLVAARGQLMQALPGGGAMVAIQATEAEAQLLLDGSGAGVSVAAINGPTSVVLSGDEDAVTELAKRWAAQGHKTRRLQVSHAFHSARMDAMLDDFGEVAGRLSFAAPRIEVVSNMSGEAATAEELGRPEYWMRHARHTVRFLDGMRYLKDRGVTAYVELGPDGVLAAMGQECLTEETRPQTVPAVFAPALRAGRSETRTLLAALGAVHVRGVDVDWDAVLAGQRGRKVDLPTYAFQHERYWLDVPPSGGDASSLGLDTAGHPFLGAAVQLAGDGGTLFTGLLSVSAHPWLANHVVMGTTVLPATAFVEMALTAADRVGCDQIEELTLEAPLALPEHNGVRLQLTVGGPDAAGKRALSIYSQSGEGSAGETWPEQSWIRHATGQLIQGVSEPLPASSELTAWPPDGAVAVGADDVYQRLAEAGLSYGPAFQAVREVWRLGDDIYAEVRLADDQLAEARRFRIHPVLLDAALHPAASQVGGEAGQTRIPFSWRGVTLHATGATALRVRLAPAGPDAMSVSVADATGAPVATIDALTVRVVSADQLAAGRPRQDALFELTWTSPPTATGTAIPPATCAAIGTGGPGPDITDLGMSSIGTFPDLAALDAAATASGAPVPNIVFAAVLSDGPPGIGAPDGSMAAHAATSRILSLAQAWLTDAAFASSRLVVVTQGAVATHSGEDVDNLAHAPVWGLIRSAQTENPGRFVLLDLDGGDFSGHLLAAALASGEPQIAVRGDSWSVPRLARASLSAIQRPVSLDPAGTVLVTGATGALGALTARHLTTEHGVRHLLLASRRGGEAAGADELESELTGLGATVTLVACDVADRDALETMLAKIPSDHPLTAVIHTAGVLDNGVISALTTQQLDAVLYPKVNGAWNLHELTQGQSLSAFVLYSSVAGTVGAPGQANYAAASAFLDALACHRQAEGLPATSLAWGPWEYASGMAGQAAGADKARLARSGMWPLPVAQGLALLDATLGAGPPVLIPARLDMGTLQTWAGSDTLPPVLRGLVRPRRLSTSASGAIPMAERLAGVPEAERDGIVLEFVRTQVAEVLGHGSLDAVNADMAFGDLGFDSLTAVELRNRLGGTTGLRLPASLIFDYPTPAALAVYLRTEITPAAEPLPVFTELARLESAMAAITPDDTRRPEITNRLRAALATWSARSSTPAKDAVEDKIKLATSGEIFDFIDQELGRSPG